MKLLRINMKEEKIEFEDLPSDWLPIGGSALLARIMNREVPPMADPLGPENTFILAAGPLAGTGAPQCGRISIGAKSPLTRGIKEANAGGPAGQFLDRLGIRAVIVEGDPADGRLFVLAITEEGAALIPAEEYRGLKNYELAGRLQQRFSRRAAIVSVGPAGERKYRGASVSLTDLFGDPSRNAARGGLGAVLGAKGLKAIVIEPGKSGPVKKADPEAFRRLVTSWIDTLKHDVSCSLYARFGTPFAVANSASQGTLPTRNYSAGRPEDYMALSGNNIQRILFERGGRMHGCMPGCVVRCSIVYPDREGRRLCAAYEYEAIALLGTNLGMTDPDAVARLKFLCDDLGVDAIETGSALGLAAEAGKMTFGDEASAARLLQEIERETPLGRALGNGVVATAEYLDIDRVPAYKGQALPGHDPRSTKGTGVTYYTSPMGADHTAGLTYRIPRSRTRQAENSLRAQVQAAVCDAFGYCLNAVPGGRTSLYPFLADLLNARFGGRWTAEEVVEIGKQTLRDQLAFNEKAEFNRTEAGEGDFIRREAIAPTNQVFDVEEAEIRQFWAGLDTFREKEKIWEVRIPPLPETLFGAGVAGKMGEALKRLKVEKLFIVTDPLMASLGRAEEIRRIVEPRGLETVVFSEVEPDPPIELIEKAGRRYDETGCDGILGLGGGSSMDTAKALGLRVTHSGDMREFEGVVGGGGKIRPVLPPIVCLPTTSGTGSEVNPCAVITDRERDLKLVLMSNHLIPRLAVIDPLFCRTMPPSLTVASGIDALAHCIEGYVSLATPYHPYFESMAVYGVKLIGRSLPRAYRDGEDIAARTDMCMAALCGGLAFLKGLGLGHALTHVLGAHYHLPHGRAAVYGLLAFVRANRETCRDPFTDLAQMLTRTNDLEESLLDFYGKLALKVSLKDEGIPGEDLEKIAFFTSRDAVNMATDPTTPGRRKILELLEGMYD